MRMFNPPHPGEVLREYLGDVTVTHAAKHLRVTRAALSRILNGSTLQTSRRPKRRALRRGSSRSRCTVVHGTSQGPWAILASGCQFAR